MKHKKTAALIAAFMVTATLGGCAAKPGSLYAPEPDELPEESESEGRLNEGVEQEPELRMPEEETGEKEVIPPAVPSAKTVSYIMVSSDGVNIRSGAGTDYASRGTAEKSTLYALNGQSGKWVKTGYKNSDAYIYSDYCKTIEMAASENEKIEAVIAEGTKLLGTAYVYGAIRYHSGNGTLLNGFTTSAFDCSSLMQYIFKLGAQVNLQVTTRTQILQGTTVSASELQRGDLMFFTNASRKNLTGIERVGHVALYLGDNYILHTASDYAKIEQISPQRWAYFIQGQRIL